MNARRNLRLSLLLAAVAVAAACGTGTSGGDGPVDVEGTWGAEGTRSPHLILEDGTFTGSDGCNRLRGNYEVEGDQVTFSLQLHTMMACPGVETWLTDLSSARVDGDTLIVFGQDDQRIGTLDRSS